MNFGEIIKAEILGKHIKDSATKKAFLSGFIRGTGALYEKDGETGLMFKVFGEDTLELVSQYFSSLFDYELREITAEEDRLNKKYRFTVFINGDGAEEIILSLGILKRERDGGYSVNFDFYSDLKSEEEFKAFIRGLFVSAGGCTVPSVGGGGTGYHLELVFFHPQTASRTSEVLASHGIKTRITRRKESYLAYIKSAEEIKDFIAFLPAPVSVLKFTDIMIDRELKNDSNRRKNCDLGNVTRQVEASMRQAEEIDLLEKEGLLSSLKPELAETARARRNFPEDTMTELAERLSITKSCLNHRLRKISETAEKLKHKGN